MATIGETLRAARERRGLSLSEASRLTRIAPRFLVALEEDDYAALPAPVYARGFLRSYAALLGLDPEPLVAALRAQLERPPDVVGYEESERFAAGPSEERTASTRWRAAQPSPEELPFQWGADVLRERPPSGVGKLWVALLLGAIILAVVLFAVALSRCGGAGEGQAPPAAADLPTASPGATVIAIVPGTDTEGPTPSPAGSPATEAPGGTATGTATAPPAASPISTPPPAATAPGSATPTPTPPPATPTPTRTPTPTPTPPPPPGVSGFAECPREGASVRCPQQEEYRVVCYPGGWFLDLEPYYPVPDAPGWRVIVLPDWRDAVGRDPCAS